MSKNLTKGTFGTFPAAICKGRNPIQQVILSWLWFHTNQEGMCFPSLSTLATECGISTQSVKNHLKVLETDGLIKRTKRKKKGKKENDSTLYEVLLKVGNHVSNVGNEISNPRQPRVQQVGNHVSSNQTQSNQTHLTKREKSKESGVTLLPVFPLSATNRSKVFEILGSHSELENFIAYWTEPNTRTGVPRWQTQDFFDVARRAGTWNRRRGGSKPTQAFTPSYD